MRPKFCNQWIAWKLKGFNTDSKSIDSRLVMASTAMATMAMPKRFYEIIRLECLKIKLLSNGFVSIISKACVTSIKLLSHELAFELTQDVNDSPVQNTWA